MSIVTGCPTCHTAIIEGEYHPCSGIHKSERPPIGIMPRYIWREKRLQDVIGAILRYVNDCRSIPPEWIEEYNELVRGGD